MLEEIVQSRYLSYKIDTHAIIDWLASTAIKHGYSSIDLESESSNISKPKVDENGNKKKKKKKKKKPNLPRTHIVRPSQWDHLADYISKISDEGFAVPQIFFKILQHTISGRQEVALAYKSDKGHDFCIEQLQKVYDILLPRRSKNSSLKEDDAFIAIWKQQTSDPGVKKLQTRYKSEDLNKDADFILAAYFFILDIIDIRRYVNDLWRVYNEGHIDLISVTLVTEYATAIVKQLETEFDTEHPEKTDYESKVGPYMAVKGDLAGLDLAKRELPEDSINIGMYDDAENAMVNCYFTLQAYALLSKPDLQKLKLGFLQKASVPTTKDRTSMLPRAKIQADRISLSQFLAVFSSFFFEDEIPSDDFLKEAYRNLLEKGQPHIWEIFAFQIYLDIHHVLGSNISSPFSYIRKEADLIITKMKQHEKFCSVTKRMGLLGETEDFDRVIEGLQKPLVQLILENCPSRCGVYILVLRMYLQSYGNSVIDITGSISAMCQMYNALRQLNAIHLPWADLDFIIEANGSNSIFGSTIPTNLAACFNQVMEIGDRGIRRINRRIDLSKATAMTRLIWSLIQQRDRLASPEVLNSLIVNLIPALSEDGSKDVSKSIFMHSELGMKEIASRAKIWGKSTSTDILANLAIAIQVEMRPLCFDYLEMHRLCWKPFSDIRAKYNEKKVQPFGQVEDDSLSEIGLLCIWDGLRRENPKLGQRARIWEDSSDCISKYLEAGFGIIVTRGLPSMPDPNKTPYPVISV